MEQEFAVERIISSELPIKSAYAIDRKRGKATRRATALLAASIAMRLSGNRYFTFKNPINIGEIRKEFVRKGLSRHYAEIITKGAEGNGTDPFWRLFSIDRDNPRRLNLRSTKGPWKQVVFYVSEKKLMDSQVSSRLTKRIAVKVADNAGKLNALFKETMKAINTAQEFLLAYDGTNCGRKDEISQTSVAGENPQDGKNPAAQAEERLLSIAGKQIKTSRALRTIMAYSRASKKKAVEAKREMEKRMNVTFHHDKQYIDKGSIMEARATAEGFLKAGIFATTLKRIPTRVLVQHVDEMAIHTPYRYTYIKYMKKRYAAILRGVKRPGHEKAKAIREKDLYIPTNLVKDMIFGIRPDTLIYKESKGRRDKLAESLSKYSVDTYGMKMAEAALSELAKGKTPATSVKIWEEGGTMSGIWSSPMGEETCKGHEGRPILDYDAKAKSARIGNTVTEFLEGGIRISCGGRSFTYPYGDVNRKKIKPRGEEMPEEFEDRMRFIQFYEGRLRVIGSYAEAIQNRIAYMEREARRELLKGRKEMEPRGPYTGRYDSALYEAARRSGAAPKPYTKQVDMQKSLVKSFQEDSYRYVSQAQRRPERSGDPGRKTNRPGQGDQAHGERGKDGHRKPVRDQPGGDAGEDRGEDGRKNGPDTPERSLLDDTRRRPEQEGKPDPIRLVERGRQEEGRRKTEGGKGEPEEEEGRKPRQLHHGTLFRRQAIRRRKPRADRGNEEEEQEPPFDQGRAPPDLQGLRQIHGGKRLRGGSGTPDPEHP